MNEHFKVRSMTDDDSSFVYANWLHTYRKGSPFSRCLRKDVYFTGQTSLINHLLASPDTTVLIACLPDDEDVCLGFLVLSSSEIAHYAYVKESFQRMGILKAMLAHGGLAEQPLTFTHWTRDMGPIIDKHQEHKFNPYLIQGGFEDGKTKGGAG